MSFTKKNFGGNVGAGSDTAKMFMYKTADTKAAVIASGYFNALVDIVKVGDVLLLRSSMFYCSFFLVEFIGGVYSG